MASNPATARDDDDELPALDPDPVPGKRSRPSGGSGRGPGRPSKASVVTGIQTEIEAYLKLAAATWSLSDPDCAGALSDQSRAMASAAAALIARNPKMVESFHTGTLIGDVVKLLTASAPVIKAIASHHVGKQQQQEVGPDDLADRFPAYAPR